MGVKTGSVIAECLDKYRRWELGHRTGVLVRTSAGQVWVLWDGDEEPTYYTQGDARYWVDTNRWRISAPRERTVFSVIGGKEPESSQIPAALTSPSGDGSIASRREGGTPLTEEDDMAAEASKTEEPTKAETLSAKNIARRLGTDPKTLRKFFRSAASTVEPVGQGGRYEFDPKDLPKIAKEFKAWEGNKGAPAAKKPSTPATAKGSKAKAAPAVEEIDEEESEPSESDLVELDDELSLGDLDD